jgi:hypothetical protein
MTIAELLAATGLTANDLVPIYDAEAAQSVEPTQKITAAQFAAAVKVLASLVNTTEMDAAIQQSTAIVDHGSNANGTYVKFSDGTMICYRVISPLSMNANQTTTETFNFPASFYSTPGVWLTLNTSIPDKLIVSTYGVSTTQYVINKVSTFSATQGPACYVLAVGRWKA